MRENLDNYKKIKGLMFWAKQTFISDKGMEIMPTLENLGNFKEKVRNILVLLNEIEEKIYALPNES